MENMVVMCNNLLLINRPLKEEEALLHQHLCRFLAAKFKQFWIDLERENAKFDQSEDLEPPAAGGLTTP